MLKTGLEKGMISQCSPGEWPKNIWAISDAGEMFEAQLENVVQGVYHGYPMPEDDDFRLQVKEEWAKR